MMRLAFGAIIALGLALAQAAELRIDATPAEGFDNDVIDDVLELRGQGLRSVSLLYVGYADSARDWLAPMKKVRVPRKSLPWRMTRVVVPTPEAMCTSGFRAAVVG